MGTFATSVERQTEEEFEELKRCLNALLGIETDFAPCFMEKDTQYGSQGPTGQGTGGRGKTKRYLIERNIPAVGSFEHEQLRAAARKSNAALKELGSGIQWLQSFVAPDKTFCVYLATDEDIIRKHADLSGIPATRITEIARMIDPTTGS